MRTTYLLLLPVALVCCTQNENAPDSQTRHVMMAPPAMKASYAPISEESYAVVDEVAAIDALKITERKLIRNGRIEFRTKDVAHTKTELSKICESLQAYVSNDTQRDDKEILSYSQTIRVPESGFDSLLAKIEKLAQHIDHSNINTDDVTEEYIDLEGRLKAKLALEKRYLDLLSKAYKVSELLQIEKEMSTVRGDIESMQGSLNYMRNRVAYSTLDVTYYEEKVIAADPGFASHVAKSLQHGWEDALAFIVKAITLWPMVLVGVVPVAVGMRVWKRRKKRLVTGN